LNCVVVSFGKVDIATAVDVDCDLASWNEGEERIMELIMTHK
jgi:hypothetical protein